MAALPNFYVADVGIKIIALLTQTCGTCDGTGKAEGVTCETCGGIGYIPYDLTGATVDFTFIKRSGAVMEKPATPESPLSAGKASHTWAAGDLDQAGIWHCIVTVVKGSVILHARFTFTVGDIT